MSNSQTPPMTTDVSEDHACKHFTLSEPGGDVTEAPPTTIADFCTSLENNNPPVATMLSIFFFPRVYEDEPDGTPIFLRNEAICRRLSAAMHIDPYFFTKEGWDSNGFFMTPSTWIVEKKTTYHSSTSRFLIKLLQDEKSKVPYNWLFISFCVISVKHHDSSQKPSQIVVCFDDCSNPLMHESIMKACKDYVSDACASHPVGMQGVLARAMAVEYDKALWRFRKPVRTIEKVYPQKNPDVNGTDDEKSRQEFIGIIGADDSQDERQGTDRIMNKYEGMAEMSRHVIHMKETLQAAARVVGSILEASNRACSSKNDQIDTEVFQSLRYSRDFLENLQLRTEAFVDRLQNEMTLAFNIVNAADLKATRQLVKDSREDGRDVAAVLTLVTLAFFPSTVISGFFGMNFFVPSTDNRRIEPTPDIWMFVIIDVVLTAIPLLYWGVNYRGWFGKESRQPKNGVRRFLRRTQSKLVENGV